MLTLVRKLYHHPLLSRLFPTTVYLLKRELSNCHSVLDLGCGPDSPLQHCTHIQYSVGVEPYIPYIKRSRKQKIHSTYLSSKIENLNFKPGEFDAVIMIEVLEHLPKSKGRQILNKAKKWAKKKVVITTPNGFISQQSLDDNPLQRHLSGWSVADLTKLGFKVIGLAGLKQLRQESQDHSMNDDILKTIRFQPKPLWFLIASLSQALTSHFPTSAFELFAVYQHRSS